MKANPGFHPEKTNNSSKTFGHREIMGETEERETEKCNKLKKLHERDDNRHIPGLKDIQGGPFGNGLQFPDQAEP